MGLSERNADGIRLRPDGSPALCRVPAHEGPKKEVCELVVVLAGGGVQATPLARANYLIERLNTNTHDASGWHCDRLPAAAWTYGWNMARPVATRYRDVRPRLARLVLSNGETGVEPPEQPRDEAGL